MLNSLHKVLSIIKNGQKNNLLVVTCKETKIAIQVLNVLQENGFILGYRYKKEPHTLNGANGQGTGQGTRQGTIININRKTETDKEIEILLKYNKEKPVIKSCVLISKPSKKIYKSIKELQSMQERQSIKSNKKGTKRKLSLQEPFANRDDRFVTAGLRNGATKKNSPPSSKEVKGKEENGLFTSKTYEEEKNWKSLINGMYILTTVKGIISDKTALKYNISGQIICKIN